MCSKSEPPKVGGSRWAIGSDESMNGTKDDVNTETLCLLRLSLFALILVHVILMNVLFLEQGASSISGKSRMTEWTCERKSQAGNTRKQKLKRCTSLHPFRLRTEVCVAQSCFENMPRTSPELETQKWWNSQERGAVKDYLFSKRLQQLWEEEQRKRIPLAQGLPWTTEEPAVRSISVSFICFNCPLITHAMPHSALLFVPAGSTKAPSEGTNEARRIQVFYRRQSHRKSRVRRIRKCINRTLHSLTPECTGPIDAH